MATDCPICFLPDGTFQISTHRIDGHVVDRVHPDLFHLHCLRAIHDKRCPMCRDIMVLPNETAHALLQPVQAVRQAVGPLLTTAWWKDHLQRLIGAVRRVAGPLLTTAWWKEHTQHSVQIIRRNVLLWTSWLKDHTHQLVQSVQRLARNLLAVRPMNPAQIEQSNSETRRIGFSHFG
jgi:hypothetical protein